VSRPENRSDAPTPSAQPPLGQPAASIPRWLALVVLIALLASGAWSTWLILSPESDADPPSAPSPESPVAVER